MYDKFVIILEKSKGFVKPDDAISVLLIILILCTTCIIFSNSAKLPPKDVISTFRLSSLPCSSFVKSSNSKSPI